MSLLKLTQVSLEDNGVELEEYELEVYGKIVDFTEIEKKASHYEYQEQYGLRKDRGSIRVRMTKTDDDVKYVMTTKTWSDKRNKRKEAEIEVTEAMFEHFKSIAESGMIKRRYFVPMGEIIETTEAGEIKTPLEWQVDVFYDEEGNRKDWCKIDLEGIPEDIELPELPIQLEEAITNQYGERTQAEIDTLTRLFKEEFAVYPNRDQTEAA